MSVTLYQALKRVAKLENWEVRLNSFDDIASRSFVIRLAVKGYDLVRGSYLAAAYISAYGLKWYFSIQPTNDRTADVICTAIYPNEKKQYDYLSELLEESEFLIYSDGIPRFVHLCKTIFNPRSFLRYLRILSILRRISRKYSFMPACRLCSTLFLYLRFQEILSKRKIRCTSTSSTYSPDSVALALAGRSLEIPWLYIAHAPTPLKLSAPRLDAEVVIINGPSDVSVYQQTAEVSGSICYRGAEGEFAPLRVPSGELKDIRLGVFLTAPVLVKNLQQFLSMLFSVHHVPELLLRPYPISLANPDFKKLLAGFANVNLSDGGPLQEDSNKCDFIIAGDSGLHFEVLRGGVPTGYIDYLDTAPYDFYNLVKRKIVHHITEPETFSLNDLKETYDSDWGTRFSHYDGAYGLSNDERNNRIKRHLGETLGLR